MTIQTLEAIRTLAQSSIANKLPTETHASYPVPTRLGAPRVEVLYCVGILKPKVGLTLLAPDHRGAFDVEAGTMLALDAVVPADLGQADAPHQVLGRFDMMHTAKTPDAYLDAERRIHVAFDELVPHFCAGTPRPPPSVEIAAQGFVDLFKTVTEVVLWPYYERLGQAYWAWLLTA